MNNGMKYGGGLFLLLILFSCGRQISKESMETEQECLAPGDTTRIVRLATEYLEHLKNKEFDEALNMLHVIRHDSVFGLDDVDIKKMKAQYETFPVLAYQINGCFIKGFHKTEVAYSIEFFKKEVEDKIPNTLNFRLNPQKINNIWYLSLVTR